MIHIIIASIRIYLLQYDFWFLIFHVKCLIYTYENNEMLNEYYIYIYIKIKKFWSQNAEWVPVVMSYPVNICIRLEQKRHRPYVAAGWATGGDRWVSLIVAPWVDTLSFDRQLLPAQWRLGSIVRAKLYMHASYAIHPWKTRSIERTISAI